MRVQFPDFVANDFSFHDQPVLVLEGFWAPEELAYFQDAMKRWRWTPLSNLPDVQQVFTNCGNWLKRQFNQEDRDVFLKRMNLPCISDYLDSFPNVKQRHIGFSFYAFGIGDCLTIHDDSEGYSNQQRVVQRRLSIATYLHSEWNHNWGGELILYKTTRDATGEQVLEVSHCIPPKSGSLVAFTVPRPHRVCRIDPLAGKHKRLSISGWFSTEH